MSQRKSNAASELRPRALHVGVGQSRRPARRRHRGQPDRQPVAGAARSIGRRRSRRPAVLRCRRPRAWRRASAGTSLFYLVRARDWRRTVAGPGRTGVRSLEGARTPPCPSRPPCRRTDNASPSCVRQANGTWRSCRRTARTHERWPRPSKYKVRRARAAPTGRRTALDRDRRQRRPGPALFKIPVDGGEPVRLVAGQAVNPVWSPDGNLIVYGGPLVAGQVPAAWSATGRRAGRAAGRARPSRAAIASCPNGNGTGVPAPHSAPGFLAARSRHERSPVSSPASAITATLRTFDITPDGKQHRVRPLARELGHRPDRSAEIVARPRSLARASRGRPRFSLTPTIARRGSMKTVG